MQQGNAVTMAVTISALPRKGWNHLCLPRFTVHPLRWELGAAALMVWKLALPWEEQVVHISQLLASRCCRFRLPPVASFLVLLPHLMG